MKVSEFTGSFAGDKDAAAVIRDEYIRPALDRQQEVVIDFDRVDLATQSFIHALVAAIIREDPSRLYLISFKNCNSSIQSLI